LRPRTLLVSGLLLVIASGAFALFSGGAFLAERSFDWKIEALGGLRLGTAFLFDVGVCLVSAGALFLLLQVLEAHGPWRR
ncbi:MAG TPA: MnhB domain-containing protein, partial [Planctomycetota bacterium]|nr:MnhB domain-containing protein [Planctomycetota bacterium]